MRIEDFVAKLEGVRERGENRYEALCPAHEDKDPSLSVALGTDGRILLRCFGGCDFKAVVGAVGLEPKDLMPERSGWLRNPIADLARLRGWSVEAFRALGAENNDYEVLLHMRDGAGKVIGRRRRRGDGRVYPNGRKVLSVEDSKNGLLMPWPLPEGDVLLCEGEADALAAYSAGHRAVVATPGGSPGHRCLDFLPQVLAGRRVVMCADPDEAGEEWTRSIQVILLRVVASLKAIPPDKAAGDLDKRLARSEDKAAELQRLMATSKRADGRLSLPASHENRAADQLQDEIDQIRDGRLVTVPLPWPRLASASKALRPGTVTVLCGPPGHGKSFLLLEALARVHQRGDSFAMMPLEDARVDVAKRLLALLCGQWAVLEDAPELAPTITRLLGEHRDELQAFMANVCENPRANVGEQEKIPELPYGTVCDWLERACSRYRVVAIDPIAQIDFGQPSFRGEKDFMRMVVGIAARTKSSVVLLAHTRKRPGASPKVPLCLEDVQGAAEITRLAHTVLMLETHEEREVEVRGFGDITMPTHTSRTVIVAKARNGPGAGMRIAFELSGERPGFRELGMIMPRRRKNGGEAAPPWVSRDDHDLENDAPLLGGTS